jgi:Na+/H+-dicarboxylate symporter
MVFTPPRLGPLVCRGKRAGDDGLTGIVFGLVVGEWAANLKFVGDTFIRLIQMSIVPLVASSVIVATGAMTGAGAGRLAGATFGWMLRFAVVAAFVGWGLAELIQPGSGMRYDGELDPTLTDSAAATAVGWQQTVTGFVSTNVVEAMATGAMVPIIVFALIFGLALNRYTAMNGPTVVLTFFEQIQAIVLLMIRYVMFLAPIGVFCLLADLAGRVGFGVVTTALAYLGTTLAGVVIISVLYVVVVVAVTRLNPLRLPAKLAEQTVVAVTTTSSAVTFPTVLKNAVEKFGISKRVADFTLCLGMTMGSCGAVLNYTIVVLFLAQASGVALSRATSRSGWRSRCCSTSARSPSPAGSRSSRSSWPRPWTCPSRPPGCSSRWTGSPGSCVRSSTSTETPWSLCWWRTARMRSTGTCTPGRSRWWSLSRRWRPDRMAAWT